MRNRHCFGRDFTGFLPDPHEEYVKRLERNDQQKSRLPDFDLRKRVFEQTIQKKEPSFDDSLEATTRFELVIRVLQTHALPLGYVAIFS